MPGELIPSVLGAETEPFHRSGRGELAKTTVESASFTLTIWQACIDPMGRSPAVEAGRPIYVIKRHGKFKVSLISYLAHVGNWAIFSGEIDLPAVQKVLQTQFAITDIHPNPHHGRRVGLIRVPAFYVAHGLANHDDLDDDYPPPLLEDAWAKVPSQNMIGGTLTFDPTYRIDLLSCKAQYHRLEWIFSTDDETLPRIREEPIDPLKVRIRGISEWKYQAAEECPNRKGIAWLRSKARYAINSLASTTGTNNKTPRSLITHAARPHATTKPAKH